MCGRFALGVPRSQVQQLHGYNVPVGDWVGQDRFQPRHNIAPHTNAPVIRRRNSGPSGSHPAPNEPKSENGSPESSTETPSNEVIVHTMKWGLVPHWAKFEDKTLNTTNARSENLVEGGGMWGSIKGRKRCAIPCEGYYEWLKKGKDRLPHFTKLKGDKLMLLAGLYDCVILEGQTEPLWTFTIVTTSANKEFSWLHDRQPVILPTTEALMKWLDTSSQTWTHELSQLVDPYSDTESPLECYQVPKEVGKVGVESPTFVKPVTQRKDGIQAMFAKQQKIATMAPSSTLAKRVRSSSPPPIVLSSGDEVQTISPGSSQPKVKKPKSTKEEDSDIEFLGQSETKISPMVLEVETKSSSSTSAGKLPAHKNAGRKNKPSASSGRITYFFNKS